MVFVLVHSVVILSLAFLFYTKQEDSVRPFFWPAFILKMFAGIALGLMYRYYYPGGDTFTYYQDAVKLASLAGWDVKHYLHFLWSSDPSMPIWDALSFQQPRALFLSKVASIIGLFAGSHYWIMASYFSLISFICAWLLVKEIVQYHSKARVPAAIAFLFFPSIVFWTSGLLKESLAMACLFFLTVCFIRLWRRARISPIRWVVLPVACWILWNLKYYFVAVWLPVAATAMVMRLFFEPRIKRSATGLYILIWFGLFLIPLCLAGFIHPNFHPERFLEVIVWNNNAFMALSDREDVITFATLQPNAWSILKNSPQALFAGLFQPLFWNVSNVLQGLAALENFVLMLLFVTTMWRLVTTRSNVVDRLAVPLVVYIVLLCVFITLSTPNLGTLSRYRVGFLPFFVLLISYKNPIIESLEEFVQRTFTRVVRK